jgi:predicted Zn-dependent peptidase
VSAEALTRAKVAAKLALAARGESALGLAQLVAEQTLLGQKVDAAAIDKVSKDDLVRVVKAAVAKNPAFVVVGEVENVPYADELAALLRA